jgi:AraC-like DNA-binding protein
MTVEEFNTEKGLYIFGIDNIETEFHSHPAIEIVIARKGTFTLWTARTCIKNLKFAIIAANQKHKLSSTGCEMKVILIEHHNKLVNAHFGFAEMDFKHGCYFQTGQVREPGIIDKIFQAIKEGEYETEYDDRITAAIAYLNGNELSYGLMIKTLQSVTNLSESRLSHLFKSSIGISLKKYLIWTRLKATIKLHLHSSDGLFSSLIHSGFYDQPHFSRNFKAMFGVKPSKAYHSRNVQVLSPLTE